MADWLAWRGETPGPMWGRVRRGGHLVRPVAGLSEQAITDVCVRRAEDASTKTFTPHDMRRTFMSNLLDVGVDLVTVQRLAGHASPATTGRYDRRGERAKVAAVRRLHIAYRSQAREMGP